LHTYHTKSDQIQSEYYFLMATLAMDSTLA